MKALLVLLPLLALSISSNPCKPFGLRLNYGRSIYDSSSDQQLALRFNTRHDCPDVELQMFINKKSSRVPCSVKGVQHILPHQEKYNTYIHICSLTEDTWFDTDLEYNLVNAESSEQILTNNIKTRIKNPHKKDQEFRFLHLADWGPSTNLSILQNYTTIDPVVEALVRAGGVDCAIINGDIGYEFNSNATHHEQTMLLIQRVASLVPIIVNRGNHEKHTNLSTVAEMFEDYFQLYDLELYNATGITVGPVFLAVFDPINMLIPKDFPKFTEESLYSSLDQTSKLVEQARKDNKTIVGVTHYPLICGFPNKGHCAPNEKFRQIMPLYVNLNDFYTLLLENSIPLMLSGHVHAYERSHPLISGYRFRPQQSGSPYVFDGQFFIQVVEGVCGSNTGLDDDAFEGGKVYKAPEFVASHSELQTGFGVFHASPHQLKYEHFELAKGKDMALFDSFVIELRKPKQPTKRAQEL